MLENTGTHGWCLVAQPAGQVRLARSCPGPELSDNLTASFLRVGQGVHLLAGGRVKIAVDAVELIVQPLVLGVRLDGTNDTAAVDYA